MCSPRAARSSAAARRTPVDFAYAIHTDIGNQAVAAKVNGEFVPLRTEMSSGDTVEIVTSPASRPNAQWLNYVRTGRARSEIRHYLRTVKYESVAFGERLLGQAMQELHMPLPATDDPAWQKLARSTGASSREEILADIGLGKRLAAVVARRFAPEHQLVATTAAAVDELTSARSAPILIQGNEGQAVQLAPCCGPARRPHHRRHAHGPRSGRTPPTARWPCASLREPERWINVGWDTHTAKHLATRLDIVTRNERGVLAGWPPRSRPPTPTSSTSRCTTTRLPRCRCT